MSKTYRLGRLHSLGPITVSQAQSGHWVVAWSVEWEFGELLDAMEHLGTLVGFDRATANYRVSVKIEPERTHKHGGSAQPRVAHHDGAGGAKAPAAVVHKGGGA